MSNNELRDYLLTQTSEIEISDTLERIKCIKGFVESPIFESLLIAFIERFQKSHHKYMKHPTMNFMDATFLWSLPYMCFLSEQTITSNSYLSNIIEKGDLWNLFKPIEDLLADVDAMRETGPFMTDVRNLKYRIVLQRPWYFMGQFMTAVDLSKEIFIKNKDTTSDKKYLSLEINPFTKLFKAFRDNMAQVRKKQDSGVPITGQIQQGWLKIFEELKEYANQTEAKQFISEDNLLSLNMVAKGLIPDSLNRLDIYVLYKPSRADKRLLCDNLFNIHQCLVPQNKKFETWEKREMKLGKDSKIKSKELSKYYEVLSRKMKRYFGVEFHEIA